jgi:Alcohol dehydrogenase GroES-associated
MLNTTLGARRQIGTADPRSGSVGAPAARRQTGTCCCRARFEWAVGYQGLPPGAGTRIIGGEEMRALCWHGKKDIRCDTVPDPKIEAPHDAIVKVTSCAL